MMVCLLQLFICYSCLFVMMVVDFSYVGMMGVGNVIQTLSLKMAETVILILVFPKACQVLIEVRF